MPNIETLEDRALGAVEVEMLQHAVAAVREKYPMLHWGGLTGPGEPLAGGRSQQDSLLTAIAYLRRCQARRTPSINSYALKHRMESWGQRHGWSPYVANGDAIAAAVYLDFVVKPHGWPSPNADIGVSLLSVRALAADGECYREA